MRRRTAVKKWLRLCYLFELFSFQKLFLSPNLHECTISKAFQLSEHTGTPGVTRCTKRIDIPTWKFLFRLFDCMEWVQGVKWNVEYYSVLVQMMTCNMCMCTKNRIRHCTRNRRSSEIDTALHNNSCISSVLLCSVWEYVLFYRNNQQQDTKLICWYRSHDREHGECTSFSSAVWIRVGEYVEELHE